MFAQILSPAATLWDQQTLFVIHGPGELPRELLAAWGPLTDEGWTLVFPQWETSEELRDSFDECRRKHGLDPERIVIAGVADGAPVARELSRETGRPCVCASDSEPPSVVATQARRSL